MADVLKFPEKPFTPADDEGSWGTGEAFCMHCKHEWVAVAPVDTVELECPQCSTHKGVFKYKWAVPTSTSVWATGASVQANGRADRVFSHKLRMQVEPVENGYIVEFGGPPGAVGKVCVATALEQVQEHVVRAITEFRLEE